MVAYFFTLKNKKTKEVDILKIFFFHPAFSYRGFLPLMKLLLVPVGHPLADGPTDPLIAKTLFLLLILFIIGSVLQFRKQRKINKAL